MSAQGYNCSQTSHGTCAAVCVRIEAGSKVAIAVDITLVCRLSLLARCKAYHSVSTNIDSVGGTQAEQSTAGTSCQANTAWSNKTSNQPTCFLLRCSQTRVRISLLTSWYTSKNLERGDKLGAFTSSTSFVWVQSVFNMALFFSFFEQDQYLKTAKLSLSYPLRICTAVDNFRCAISVKSVKGMYVTHSVNAATAVPRHFLPQ